MESGEVIEGKYRLKDTFNEGFWGDILKSPHFKKFVKYKYALGAKQAEANTKPE